MSEPQHQDLVKELEELLLKQQLGILCVSERVKLRSRLKTLLEVKGYHYASELAVTLNRTPEETKYLIETINKVFPCSRSKKKKSTAAKEKP
jgi:hypothetical protein